MPKCKLCGSRIAEGVAVCPVCKTAVKNANTTEKSYTAQVKDESLRTKCKVCGGRISAGAPQCPVCGAVLKTQNSSVPKAPAHAPLGQKSAYKTQRKNEEPDYSQTEQDAYGEVSEYEEVEENATNLPAAVNQSYEVSSYNDDYEDNDYDEENDEYDDEYEYDDSDEEDDDYENYEISSDGLIAYANHLLDDDPSPSNQREAFRCLMQAVEMGNPVAHYLVAFCYMDGVGTRKDPEEAYYHFSEAHYADVLEATTMLGMCTYWGLGVEQNTAEGKELLEQAKRRGSSNAKSFLKRINRDERKERKEMESCKNNNDDINDDDLGAAIAIGGAALLGGFLGAVFS